MWNSGGIERIISEKANWFVANTCFEITILSYAQQMDVNDFFPLHPLIKREKLLCKERTAGRHQLLQILSSYLSSHPQDICIGTFGREFQVLPALNDGSAKIVEFHFPYDIHYHWASAKYVKPIANLVGYIKTKMMKATALKYDKIVVLTKGDLRKWNCDKVFQIYNPQTIVPTEPSSCDQKTVISVGRIDNQKGYDMLIKCWEIVESKHPDWSLNIYGGRAHNLESSLLKTKMETLHFCGTTNEIEKAYIKSSVFVSCSRYEGFPLTIIEAMSFGLPVVAFNCSSGISELIADGENGYLVPESDVTFMAERICQLIESPQLLLTLSHKALLRSASFNKQEIMQQWVDLFSSVIGDM